MTQKGLVLDFDGSVGSLSDVDTIPLQDRQEAIRFGCRMATLSALGEELAPILSARQPPVVFMGSGDYHHVSFLLIERLRTPKAPVHVVVFDNHPDNMRYPFGIHCGSWVSHVSRLPFVACVHVIGITSSDVEGAHLWENHLAPLYSGRVRYWCVGRSLRAMHVLGIRQSQSFGTIGELLERFASESRTWTDPVYLSIDKDVLSPEVVQTNWDQGVMKLAELEMAIDMIKPLVIASDVTGDISSYRYKTRFKRVLTSLDGQQAIPDDAELARWQEQQRHVNRRLMEKLIDAGSDVGHLGNDSVKLTI